MSRSLLRGIFDLGFFPSERPLLLGPSQGLSRKQVVWDVASWLLIGLGIFFRQGLELQTLEWGVARLSFGAFWGSIVIAFALFPTFMRWVNRRRTQPGLEHVAIPFSFGFLLNLAKTTVLNLPH